MKIPIVNSNPRFPEIAGKSQTVGIHTVGVHASLTQHRKTLNRSRVYHRVTLEGVSVLWDKILSPMNELEVKK